jgi:3',5'-cyclic AMP phosphodiesterase CpdA
MVRPRLAVPSLFFAAIAASLAAQEQTPRPRPPRAFVFEHEDQWTKSARAAELLRAAGCEVEALPLDRSPWLLDADLIVFGSFVSEHPDYAAYMKEHAAGLYNFVDKGHVLVQHAQADQVEKTPPFLPSTHGAVRADPDHGVLAVLSPRHPLLRDVATADGKLQLSRARTGWEVFVEQGGFEVVLAGGDASDRPVLLEGAYGQGRIVLAAMAPDKASFGLAGDERFDAARAAFSRQFFANLAAHAVSVRERKAPAVAVTPPLQPPLPFEPGSWTLAVLPDTQVYALRYPGLFLMQTAWLVEQKQARDVRFAIQLGDIVNNNTDREWRNAWAAMKVLHGTIDYALVPGNHDYGPSGDASTRDTGLNAHFPFAEHAAMKTFGGAMEDGRLDNTFHLFEAWDRRWIVVCLEWGPRDAVVAWADEVMVRHPGRVGILVTHAYMNNNDRRYDHTDKEHPQHYNPHEYRTPGPMNDGEQLWQKLVRKHDFVLTLNGHVLGDGTGYLASVNDKGRTVHQILANYQFRQLGGEGYLRLMEFLPDGKTVRVKTYSPLYDRYLTAADQQFTIVIE